MKVNTPSTSPQSRPLAVKVPSAQTAASFAASSPDAAERAPDNPVRDALSNGLTAQVIPIDVAQVVPIDFQTGAAQVEPIGRAQVVPVGQAQVEPIGRAQVEPIGVASNPDVP